MCHVATSIAQAIWWRPHTSAIAIRKNVKVKGVGEVPMVPYRAGQVCRRPRCLLLLRRGDPHHLDGITDVIERAALGLWGL